MSKPKVLATFEAEPVTAFSQMIGHVFLTPLILTVVLGALGHQLHIPALFKVGYWEALLIVVALQAVWPLSPMSKTRITEPRK